MPSTGTFARIGLIVAVAVIVGISTFGSLLRQVTPRAIAIGPVPVAATPAPVLAADHAQPPAPGPAIAEPASPVTAPPSKGAVSSPPRPGEDPTRAQQPQLAQPAAEESTPSAAPAFPPVQILTEVPPAAANEPAPETHMAATPSAAPQKKSPKRAATKGRSKKRPAPYEMREFYAGRW
jgi:hypothetical protein